MPSVCWQADEPHAVEASHCEAGQFTAPFGGRWGLLCKRVLTRSEEPVSTWRERFCCGEEPTRMGMVYTLGDERLA